MLMRRVLIAVTTLCLGFGLAAEPAQAQKKSLVVALNQDPDILDPTLARTYVGRIIFAQMCEKLYEIDENLRIFHSWPPTSPPSRMAARPSRSSSGRVSSSMTARP